PYFRTNIADFWRHWHMSLYKWLVDYVFIPLGGSRGSIAFVCRNVLIVMLVSGVWHGAGLNFVVWGLWHGVLLVVHRLWSGEREARPPGFPVSIWSPLWGLWWGVLLCVILLFCGQSSKFIYIDF